MNDALKIVLVGTRHPGNIGSAARAMKTMGLSRLALVAPECFPDPHAYALAAGANDVLDVAEVHATLEDALAECRFVIGTTARRRTVTMPELPPRDAARQLVDAQARGGVALVFGRERTGLENHELQLCHASVCIPANPDYSSLNIAAAVQVLCYEIRMATLSTNANADMDAATIAASIDPDDLPATQAEMEAFFQHFSALLDDIDFHKGRPPDMISQRLRRLFQRAQPDPRELRILRGIFSDTQRLLKKS
ncbi:MAG TPA: RNA methyltransferase [Arenimonas sp.]|uniref:RNA methyltransferase n=1 Tax=Arenimonas sp. TaxID=1872635 RepID=UPI002C44413D|nr:RNA methyltransferase [Arenimonas sp.]HMB55577.1 RNA methyltransferase [Arenimonas sp.]